MFAPISRCVCNNSSSISPYKPRSCLRGLGSSCVAAAAAGKAGRYRGQSSSADHVIVPIDPSRSSNSSFLELGSDVGGRSSLAAAAAASDKPGRNKPTNTRRDGRRGALVKIRVAPRRYRLRQSFDSPRKVHMRPTDPGFEGRLTSEINSVYGPRRLNKLIQDFGQHFTAAQAAAAISLLAGMVTGKQLPDQELSDVYQAPAARMGAMLTSKIQQATLVDCARATYGLARLQLHLPDLLTAVEHHSSGQLRSATPQALAGLAVGLAHWDHQPREAWIQELCVEAFASMSGFGAQDLANLMFALAVWQTSVSQPFLLRCLTAFRGHWGSAGCHAPALIRFLYALTQLPPCQPLPPGMQQLQPEGAPVYLHHSSYRQQKGLEAMSDTMGLPFVPTPAAAAAGADASAVSEDDQVAQGVSQLQQQEQEQLHQTDPAASNGNSNSSSRSSGNMGKGNSTRSGKARHRSSTAVATYRLPSFNWLTAFLAECRRQIDRFKPAELSTLLWSMACLNHTPDLIFVESWYRASAAHMHAFTAPTLAAAMQSLGMLQPGKGVPGSVPGRWLQLVLQHSQGLIQQSGCSAGELAKLLWGFAELQVWPGRLWMQQWLEAAAPQLESASPSDLSDVIWALARLKFTPGEAWMQKLTSCIEQQLQGFSVQGLAVVIWGYTRLGYKPDRLWLLRFRALAGTSGADGADGQQLAQFVAAFLAQQNRQRFVGDASGRPARVATGQRSSDRSARSRTSEGSGRSSDSSSGSRSRGSSAGDESAQQGGSDGRVSSTAVSSRTIGVDDMNLSRRGAASRDNGGNPDLAARKAASLSGSTRPSLFKQPTGSS